MPIKILDPKVVARIAAGEVVERPASVVKELVENSLDAGSRQISVETRGGGVSLIQVVDDGVGIRSSELEFLFQRYATSKINSLDDLDSISSFGFRGEALASVAAVAQVEIATCAVGESVGSYLSMKDGKVSGKKSQVRSQGTTVTVRNLFRNVPARLKFLKSPATENSHIANVISQYALAFPEVRFSLSIDGRETLRTSGSGQLIDSVAQVYGLEVARNMLAIESSDSDWHGSPETTSIQVSGMVSSPTISRSNRDFLSFFVNRRWISSRLLSWAVEEAYHGLLMAGKHPIAIINISIPTKEVDVNVHPTKLEVKFRDEHAVFGAVQRKVRRALIEQAPVPRIEDVVTAYAATSTASRELWSKAVRSENPISSPLAAKTTPIITLPALRVLGQLSSTYIIAEGHDGLYLIDQHAGHERVLFEKIERQRSQQAIEVQGLLEPATFEVSPQQDELMKSYCEALADFGFSIEPFGNRTYLVRTVPVWLHNKDWAGVIRELLDSSLAGEKSAWTERLVASIACHSAVRAGQVLNDDEMRELIRQLEQVVIPNTCPHGRPTMIHLSSGQLQREFGRE